MRRFGKMTAANTPILMMVLLGLRVIGTLFSMFMPQIFWEYLCFDPARILQGQIWRLFTFVMCCPYRSDVSSLFFLAIMVFVFFSISQTLILVIGKYKLNFFLISGLILEVILGFVYYFLASAVPSLNDYTGTVILLNPSYLYSMLFVLFAMLFPDVRFYLMFVIPIRGKWMVFITLGLYLIEVVQAFFVVGFAYAWMLVTMIIAAILTMLLFLIVFQRKDAPKNGGFSSSSGAGSRHKTGSKTSKSGQQNADGASRIRSPFTQGARHKCAICGRTEKTNPELEFRYCSKCIGNYEYCSDHLYTHLHKYPNITDTDQK